MSKSIFVTDTPDSCVDCNLSQAYENGLVCWGSYRTLKVTIKTKAKKPDWCPLKELPEAIEQLHDAGGCDGSCEYAKGWDDAMEEAERILTAEKQEVKTAWKEHIENRFSRVE